MVTYGILMVKASASKSRSSSDGHAGDQSLYGGVPGQGARDFPGKMTVESPVFHGKTHGKSMVSGFDSPTNPLIDD